MTEENTPKAAPEEVSHSKWLGKGPVWILILILGPFALPFLFLSPHFTRGAKTGITVALLVLMLLFYLLMVWAMETAQSMGIVLP